MKLRLFSWIHGKVIIKIIKTKTDEINTFLVNHGKVKIDEINTFLVYHGKVIIKTKIFEINTFLVNTEK